jgi:hypothetical protein
MTDSVLPGRPLTTPVTPVTPATAAICPYLLASDGHWRASTPAREHRCTVVSPPAILAAEKQRRLCLSADHVTCSTYLAATSPTDADDASRPTGDQRRPRAITRTAPLVLDHSRMAIGLPALRTERGAGQTGLVALMAVAFAAIVVARLSDGGPDLTPAQAVGGGSASPSVAASPVPTAAPAATEGATRTLVPTEAEPTPAPAEPSAEAPARTYKVRSGDTLSGIAGEFGTTVPVLMELNGIEDARRLSIGQVLELP